MNVKKAFDNFSQAQLAEKMYDLDINNDLIIQKQYFSTNG